MSSELVAASVAENAAWCTLVCRTHGIGTERAGGWTRTLRPAPRFYPDLVTLDHTVTADEVVGQLADRAACSVKDSFGSLDLEPAGFKLLFEARWLALLDDDQKPAARVDAWHRVHDVAGFEEWVGTRGDAGSLRPALVDDPDTHLWFHEDPARPAGFVAHRTSEVVAVSNSFGDVEPSELWRQVVTLARRGWGSGAAQHTVVAYEPVDALAAPGSAGLEPIGPLRIWVRES